MKLINFFDPYIMIKPHTATHERHLDRAVRIEEFAQGRPVCLYELENGELRVQVYRSQEFIEGPEV